MPGCSLPPQPVLDDYIDHLRLESRVGGYEAAERESSALERTYDTAAYTAAAALGSPEIS